MFLCSASAQGTARRLLQFKNYALFLYVFLLAASCAGAQEIYKWEDDSGRTYYSDQPHRPGDKPASLPDVNKESIDQKIDKIKAETPPNCEKHGGVDCTKGPDNDGSVICLDGFKGAVLPFRFRCMEARVAADAAVTLGEETTLPVTKNNKLSQLLANRTPTALVVTLRNLSGVEAFNVRVYFLLPWSKAKKIQAIGPDKVAPYGLGEYVISRKSLEDPQYIRQWDELSYKVECTNCSTVTGRR